MAFVPNLTANSVPEIVANNLELKPVIQCIGSKVVPNPQPNATERYRLALSDGTHWCTAMLASQLNELVRNGDLVNGSILRLNEYLNQVMQGKMIIIILHVDILGHKPRIGNPQGYSAPGGAEQAFPASNNQQNGLAPSIPRTPTDLRGGPAFPANDQPQPYGSNTGAGGPPASGYGAQPMVSYQNSSYGASAGYGQGTYGQPPQAPLAEGPPQGNYGAPPAPGTGYGFGAGGGGYGQGQYTGGYGQAPAFRANNSAIARNEAAPKIVPIASLNAYQNRWTIKARVTQRSDIRRYNNARGEGKFFTVDLLDAQGGEIRAISFNEVADKFNPILQMGAVVTISKASLKPKKPGSLLMQTYNQTRHDHEITMEKQTVVEVVEDDQNENEIPQIQYHLRKIEEIEGLPATTVLDVLGVVEFAGPGDRITRKDGTEAEKRNLTIRDDSNRSIELTLWGNYAANPGQQLEAMLSEGERPLLAAKSVRIGDFNGKTLSSVGATLLTVNPDLPDAARLRNWYDNEGGAQMQATRLSENRGSSSSKFDRRCTISAIKEEGLGTNAQPAYVQILCWITLIKQESKMCYPACPLQYNGRPCNKKLTNQGEGDDTWFCDRCQQTAQPDWRYILAIQADDHTGHIWLTAFQESGLEIMGMPAAELRELEANNLPAFEALMMSKLHRPYLFKVKVAEDTYNDETRIKTNIMRAEAVDFVKESRVYLDYIRKIQRGEPVNPGQPLHMGGRYQSGAPVFGAGGGGGGFAAQGVQGGYGSDAGVYGNPAGGYGNGGYGNGGYGNQNGRGKFGAGGF